MSAQSRVAQIVAVFALIAGTSLALATHIQLLATDPHLGQLLLSRGLQHELARTLAAEWHFGWLLAYCAGVCLIVWLLGAAVLAILSASPFLQMLQCWGWRFLWLASLGAFELLWSAGGLFAEDTAQLWLACLASLMPYVHWLAAAGFITSAICLVARYRKQNRQASTSASKITEPNQHATSAVETSPALAHQDFRDHQPATDQVQVFSQESGPAQDKGLKATPQVSSKRPLDVGLCIAVFAAVLFAVTFSVLAILQYRALMVPHGDTAMYEEHLWNLLHGKGFRSQLDGGRLFLGEHLEVFHILLIPIYVLYPYLPTLNVCLSLALGCGAIAVWGITRRLTGRTGLGALLAWAYVLYFPLQYLNLEASLKTFRPENFGVPLLLFAIWALETRRWKTMLSLIGLALLCKEDYAVPAAMLGLYLLLKPANVTADFSQTKRVRLLGGALFLFNLFYLWFVLQVFIPYFRGGPPHYTGYFADLGSTPSEIAYNLLTDPSKLVLRVVTWTNLLFVLSLLLPLGGLPLLGYDRIWVGLPSLLGITLSQLEATHSPYFHFHAPLVPIIFWSAAAGLAKLVKWQDTFNLQGVTPSLGVRAAIFAVLCCLSSGFWAGKSPLSLAFYDRHSGLSGYWRMLYVPSERVRRFWERVWPLVPADASVAASDFVRPRFTHHRLCHEFGRGGLRPHVSPNDVDYIVIDLAGPFSNLLEGLAVSEEWQKYMSEWTVAYNDLQFFVVVRRRAADSQRHPSGPNQLTGSAGQ